MLPGTHLALGHKHDRSDREGSIKILAKHSRVTEPEILAESYRIYGLSHLQKSINVDLEGVRGLLKGLGNETAGANPANFVDASLVQELEKEGFFQAKSR